MPLHQLLTTIYFTGDQIVRQERLASEKILRKITNATNPKIGTRPSLTLEKAFENVSNVRDGFVNMDEFQEGMSNLGVQLSRKDCRDLFSHFNATETDTLSIHSFTALVCDRQRTEHLDSSQGMRFLSERHDDHRILLDAWGVPSRVKMAQDDDSENGQYSGTRSGIQHGRIDNSTMSKDVQKRLRVIAPKDPESARQYLLYVFRKHDNSGRNGTISHSAFRNALSNFDSTFTGRRAAAVIDVLDTNHDGRINYFEFVDSVLNIDQRMYEQIPKTTGYEKDIKINAARLSKKSERLNWNKHRWQHFQNHWVEKHGRAAAKEIARDASIPPSGESWSSAPQHKQPFRVLHSIVRAPPSPMAAPTKR
jgi:Ca2+-binding EF-hand superfamily protein